MLADHALRESTAATANFNKYGLARLIDWQP